MSQTLSRKYRPQTFAEVVGQNHIKITLQNEILTEQLAHAYLFTGPHGIGKTSMARILAKALNCHQRKEKEFEPCNKCQSCQEIIAGKSLDLIEIDAATHTQVDKVRENIVENVRFGPHQNKYKIFIIDEVHMLSLAAFNALLKTLEEPPDYIIFILCTTQVYKLPETIISRCQRFDFKKISAEQIVNKLKKIIAQEKIKINDEVLSTIALRSSGFIRDAESLLGQVVTLFTPDKKEITFTDIAAILPRSDLYAISELVDSLINNNAQKGVVIINKLVSNGVDLERFNLDLIDYWRQMILFKLSLKNQDYDTIGLSEEIRNKLTAQVEQIEMSKLIKILEKFMAIQSAIKEAEITQLPLEMAVIELCEEEENQKSMKTLKHENRKTEETLVDLNQKQRENFGFPAFQGRGLEKVNNPTNSSLDNILNNERTNEQNNGNQISLKQIKNVWPEIVSASQKLNHSLTLILKAAYPVAINNNRLELGFEFEIHVKKIKEEKHLNALEKILENILGTRLKVKPALLTGAALEEVKKQKKETAPEINEDELNQIAYSFGGKVMK